MVHCRRSFHVRGIDLYGVGRVRWISCEGVSVYVCIRYLCIRLLVYKCTCVKGVITISVVFLSYTLDLGGGSLPPSPRSHVVEVVPPPWVELEVDIPPSN